ncbi:MAG: phosphatidylserine decarboxylase [Gammaproteobacteria bacterium]|nr:phosphatidylserine decarboxylase [Gammaproteobacteria bacterium]
MSVWDYIRVLPQYLIPQHCLSRIIYWITRCEWTPLKNLLIKLFIYWFKVDMNLAKESHAENFIHFNHFFTRELKPEVRPIAQEQDVIVCPIDGYISQIGKINSGEIFQAKNRSYDLDTLLAMDNDIVSLFKDGVFATFYLSPRDYHRIHMPRDGQLQKMIYIPGKLFAVNTYTTRVVKNLFARNERVISLFETDTGPMAIIMVGAMLVSSMETVWAGQITPAKNREITNQSYLEQNKKIKLRHGEEIGRFNMGSTVILLFSKDAVEWSSNLQQDQLVSMGEKLGMCHCTTARMQEVAQRREQLPKT